MSSQLLRAAWHEAAHALAGIACGRRLLSVSAGRDGAGVARFEAADERSFSRVHLLTTTLAGPYGECRCADEETPHDLTARAAWAVDAMRVRELLAGATEAQRCMQLAAAAARGFVADHRQDIESLGNILYLSPGTEFSTDDIYRLKPSLRMSQRSNLSALEIHMLEAKVRAFNVRNMAFAAAYGRRRH